MRTGDPSRFPSFGSDCLQDGRSPPLTDVAQGPQPTPTEDPPQPQPSTDVPTNGSSGEAQQRPRKLEPMTTARQS